MTIKLIYENGEYKTLSEFPNRRHRINWKRPIRIETNDVKKFDNTGKCLTFEYNILTAMLGKKGKIVATDTQTVYEEVLEKYMYCFQQFNIYNNSNEYDIIDIKYKSGRLKLATEEKDVLERLFDNLIEPEWYVKWTEK